MGIFKKFFQSFFFFRFKTEKHDFEVGETWGKKQKKFERYTRKTDFQQPS